MTWWTGGECCIFYDDCQTPSEQSARHSQLLFSNTIKTNGGSFSFHLILLPRGFKGLHNIAFSRQDFTRQLRKPFSSIYLNITASAGIYLRNLEWQKRHSGAKIKPESGKSSSEMELVAWFQSFEITGAEIAFYPWVGRMKQILYDYVGPQYQFNILTKKTGTHTHAHTVPLNLISASPLRYPIVLLTDNVTR